MNAIATQIIAQLTADLTAWEAALAGRSDAVVITSTPWVVAQEDASLGIFVKGTALVPTPITPAVGGAPMGVTCMSKANAIKVAGIMGAGYRPMIAHEVASIRIQAIKSVIDWAQEAAA